MLASICVFLYRDSSFNEKLKSKSGGKNLSSELLKIIIIYLNSVQNKMLTSQPTTKFFLHMVLSFFRKVIRCIQTVQCVGLTFIYINEPFIEPNDESTIFTIS